MHIMGGVDVFKTIAARVLLVSKPYLCSARWRMRCDSPIHDRPRCSRRIVWPANHEHGLVPKPLRERLKHGVRLNDLVWLDL